jgi:hypothetical protein
MLCDVQIRGVEGLFDDRVEVNGEVRRSELGKASDFCFAKARDEMIIWIGKDRTYRCGFPTTTTWVRELMQVREGG